MQYHGRVVALAVLLVGLWSGTAWAAWVSPLSDGWELCTPYGASCPGGTHRGIDLTAVEGSTVLAPASGTVGFAGPVPADGGGTCIAVTLEMPDGLRISMMPLADACVSAGGTVNAGEQLGTLAASGDDSSPNVHLHLGLRRGDTYLDPASLLPVIEQTSQAVPSSVSAEAVPPASPSGGSPVPQARPAPQLAAAPIVGAAVSLPNTGAVAPESPNSLISRLPVESGIPAPSALRPALRSAPEGLQIVAGKSSAQATASIVLLAAMLVTAAFIAAPRLAEVRGR